MIIHIFKDGTETTELKDAYVPQEIVERIYNIVAKERDEDEKKKVQGA